MGVSNSSLAIPYRPVAPSYKDRTTNAPPPSHRTMISHVQTFTPQPPHQQHQRVRFTYRPSNAVKDTHIAKNRTSALVLPTPMVDHDTYIPTKSTKVQSGNLPPNEPLFSRSKSKISQAHHSPVAPGSKLNHSPSTSPQRRSTCPPITGSDQPLHASNRKHHSLPRRESASISTANSAHGKPISAAAISRSPNDRAAPTTLSRVDTAETRKRSQETSGTRIVIKSSSRSTVASKTSSSSSGALSSREGHLVATSSRLDHKDATKRRTSEEIKLKPIREAEVAEHSHLPPRPPGLHNNRNSAIVSAGTQPPILAPKKSPIETVVVSQTKRLSQILARPSVIILSPPDHHVHDNSGARDEISVEKKDGHRATGQQRASLHNADVLPENITLPDSDDADLGEQTDNREEALKVEREPDKFLPLSLYLSDPDRLAGLLQHLSLSDCYHLLNASKEIRLMLSQNELLREEILERYLREVGYCRWSWRESEPITLSLTDMFLYLKSVSTPIERYFEVAQQFLKSQPSDDDYEALTEDITRLAQATRSYNRLVLRLRAQSEILERWDTLSCCDSTFSGSSRKSSSYAIPDVVGSTASFISSSPSPSQKRHFASSPVGNSATLPSPLYRPNRAALLRVFVPSPRGEWLSDDSVLECEEELRRADISRFMKLGDVVWDIALGDEKGNSGKLIWDGCYLLDLDYTYSSTGDIPRHIPSLALPPSYFHGVIQRGPLNVDPIIRMDVSPWGEEIGRNLQLMQDRMVAKTPEGLQNVVRWVHRTTFSIRPSSIRSSSTSSSRGVRWAETGIPIRESNGRSVHPAWYGSIVIETDGTNECLEDLKARCGLGVFPQRAAAIGRHGRPRERHEGMVWRILRDKSRPGEIWLKVITPRERLM